MKKKITIGSDYLTENSRYIPKNKQNGLMKGEHRIWIESVKGLTRSEYFSLLDAIRNFSRPPLVNRNIALVSIALNNGLRASDVVSLRVGDVLKKNKSKIIEQKTGKSKTIYLNNCREEIDDYLEELDYEDENDWLFPGNNKEGHFSVHGFYQMVVRMARKTGDEKLVQKIGTHSFRKTFGNTLFENGTDVEIISQIFNHSSQKVTRHYLGIEQEDLDNVVENFKFE
ncbi:tyrosine-type recombinase/integrase [Ligilactobacillus equi]|nr:tyrosine-type recombinase/integrase [Ligilactobacillus equi]